MTDLLNTDTNKALISMSVPISIGMLSTFLFQVIDTYFVGQLGADSLAALSFASTLYFLLIGLFMGLSVGVSVIIGKASGENNLSKVRKTTILAFFLCFSLALIIVASITQLTDLIFIFLGAPHAILPLINQYIIPILWGIPLIATGIVGGGILRATGNVSQPELIMAVAGVINLVFDYLLIFGKAGLPELGIQGAAIATILSWVFVFLGMLLLLIKAQIFSFLARSKESILAIIRDIFQLSGPTITTQIIGPITIVFLTYLLAKQSALAVAAFGVAGRIEVLLMIGILGVSTAITPFIAQNSGAKRQSRIDDAIAFGGRASTYLGLLVALLLFIFIRPIAGLFSDNKEVVDYTAQYFYLVSLSYIPYGLYLITTSIFNGLQLPFNSLKITFVKALFFTSPLTIIGSFFGVEGIFIGLAVSNLLAGIYAAYQMRRNFFKTNSTLKDVSLIEAYKNDFKQLWKRITL